MMAEALLLNHHEPARRRGVSSTMAHAVAVSKVLRAAVVFACGPTAVLAQAAPPYTSKALRDALAAQGIEFQSVVGVHRTAHHVVVDTHINPSAGSVVVLTRDLEPDARCARGESPLSGRPFPAEPARPYD
jgi:hypothetical protein